MIQFRTASRRSALLRGATQLLLTTAMLSVVGCDDGGLELGSNTEPTVSWEEFRASVYKEPWPGGAFIVDGDIPLWSEEELQQFYWDWTGQESGALTVRRVGATNQIWSNQNKYSLTYCVSDSFDSRKSTVVNALQIATESWTELVGARFRYDPSQDASCDASNNSVVFNVRPVSASYFARAFFPDDGRSAREILISGSAYSTTAGGRDFQGIMRHEIGHTLGFRHEHIWINCDADGDGTTTDEEGTGNAQQLTGYDVNSVMHYPQCRGSATGGYRQTARDYEGAIEVYGLSPQLLDVLY